MKFTQISIAIGALFVLPQLSAESMEVLNIIGVQEQAQAFEQEKVGVELVVIDRDMIELAGTSDLNAILKQSVPGLTVLAKNGRYDYATYSLQGSRSKDILWLIDGNRINNRLFGGGYLDTISTAMIERIEVLKAGQSVMYGTSALAGVINIVTRSYKGTNEGQLNAGIDTMGSTQFNGYVSTKIADTEVTVFGANDQSDGYQPYNDEDIHWTTTDTERGYDVQNLGVKLAQTFGDTRVQLMAQYNLADLDYLRPYHNVQTQNKREQTLVTLQAEHGINDDHQVEFKGYYHKWDTDYFRLYQYEDGSIDLVNKDDPWGFEDYGAKMTMHSSFGEHKVNYGVEQQQYSGEDAVMNFKSNTERVTDVFGQYLPHIAALPDTKLSIGGRYTSVHDGESGTALELSGRHLLSDAWSINLAAGTSFSLPSAEQLYASDDDSAYGNRDLKPETGTNINVGVEYSHDKDQVAVNLFWREISDLIGIEQVDGGQYQYINLNDDVTTQGIDILWTSLIAQDWTLSTGLTYSDIEDSDGQEALMNVPDLAANVRVDYQPQMSNWMLWMSTNYVGTMTSYDEEYGEYTLVDLGASYKFGDSLAQTINLKIENAFDDDAQTGLFNPGSTAPENFYDGPIATLGTPRNVQLTYSYNF